MSINIGPASTDELRPKIMVIGVGGAGGNAIANMMQAQIEGVDFIVANTDAQALSNAIAEKRIQLGPDITGGLGAGARPKWARRQPKKPLRISKRRWMASICASSPPVWVAAPARALRP